MPAGTVLIGQIHWPYGNKDLPKSFYLSPDALALRNAENEPALSCIFPW